MKSSSNLAIVIQLQCGVLPATAVEPNVAFTLHLMEADSGMSSIHNLMFIFGS